MKGSIITNLILIFQILLSSLFHACFQNNIHEYVRNEKDVNQM